MSIRQGVVEDLEVCVDCAGLIANGEFYPETVADEKAILAGLEREGGYWVLDCDEDCGWFSWTACDCCRRPLGGERHGAAIILN